MNTLLSIRTNILYAKKAKKKETEKDEFIKHHELIFLVDKPSYKRTNEGEITRERMIDEFRFMISSREFDTMLDILKKLKDISEEELI